MATCVLVTTTARECQHTPTLRGHGDITICRGTVRGEGRVMAAPPRSRLAKVACAWLLLVCCLASTGDWLPLVTR